jgi:prepilin-type processing-associated H-X9-DG protein
MYAGENGGRYPDGFAALLLTQDLTAEVFVCPSSQGERAPGATPQEQAQQLSDPLHMTYVYVASGKSRPTVRADRMILAHESPDNHDKNGIHFLYADGHVEFQVKAYADDLIAEIKSGHNPPRDVLERARR